MKRNNTSHDVKYCVKILVQAYGYEPVVLCAGESNSDSVEVYREDVGVSLNYPRHYVYDFDARLFEQLRSAFEESQQERLLELWKSAKRYSIRH